jgi:hypothetical protein
MWHEYIMLVPHVRFAPKNYCLLPKYNIMPFWWPTWHIGVRLANMSAQLGVNFFRRNSKWGSNPQPHGHHKPLPLGYCFDCVVVRVIISLYYVLGCWLSPASMKSGIKPTTCQVLLLRNVSDPPVSSSCTESNQTHLSVLVALKLIFFNEKY